MIYPKPISYFTANRDFLLERFIRAVSLFQLRGNPFLTTNERQEILDKIEEEMGMEGRHVVQVLYDADTVLDLEQIESALEDVDMELESKNIRQILYGLNDRGYARSRRHRDDETGWISFLWDLFPDKILRS